MKRVASRSPWTSYVLLGFCETTLGSAPPSGSLVDRRGVGEGGLVGEPCPSCPRAVECPRRAVVPAEPRGERASAWAWHWPQSPGHVTRGPDPLGLATPSRPRHPVGSRPGRLGVLHGAEGERREENPAFSRSPLPGQRPAGSGSSLPRRRRHGQVLRPAAVTRPAPLSACSSRGSKAGLSNSQLFFVTFLRCIIPGLSCFITKNPRETTRQDQSDAGSQTVFLYFIKV